MLKERYPRSVFFGGQLVFEKDSFLTRLLHNYQGFSLQRGFFRLGIPFMIIPANVDDMRSLVGTAESTPPPPDETGRGPGAHPTSVRIWPTPGSDETGRGTGGR